MMIMIPEEEEEELDLDDLPVPLPGQPLVDDADSDAVAEAEGSSDSVNDLVNEIYTLAPSMGDLGAIGKPRKGLFQRIGEWNRRRRERRKGGLAIEEEDALLLDANETLAGNDTMTDPSETDLPASHEGFFGMIEPYTARLAPYTENLASVMDSVRVKGAPVPSNAQIPLALVLVLVIWRAIWYYRQYRTKAAKELANGTDAASVQQTNGHHSANGSAKGSSDPTVFSKHKQNGHGSTTVMAAEAKSSNSNGNSPDEDKIQATLEREMRARQALVEENRALQLALDTHKSTVDKFSTELQARNERLSVFEHEQDTVRRDLSAQIEVLKQELQERQKQEQGNLKSKESLCNDLITKIKALNQDLENHEKLWQGVAQKAQQKEVESAKKVQSLQKSLREDEQHRVAALAAKEEAAAELNAKVQALQKQQNHQTSEKSSLEQQMGSEVFPAQEAKLQKRLEEEQKLATTLTTKLQVFSAELASREERVSTLDARMNEVERLSAVELKQLQMELQKQMVQREKLQQAAVEMTRVLQEKRDQCVRLQTQWESSKAELKALDERVATLTADVQKREAMANKRIQAVERQLGEERQEQALCKKTAEATNQELVKKQEEFVQLTTRMDLFLKELQFRDEQVASLENKLTAKEERTTSEIKALSEQLLVQRDRRDSWNKTTEDLQQMLKDKKAQVVGLTTRVELFERELKNRQDGIAALQAKIEESEEAEAIKMEPYRKQLQRLQRDRDDWREKTEDIARTLEQKQIQTEGIVTRLKLFKVELDAKGERVELLKTTYQDKRQAAMLEMAPVREKLEEQREQRDFWAAKAEDIDHVYKEKSGQAVGLKTRALLFGRELETKEKVAAALEAKVADKEEAGSAVIARLRSQLEEQTKGRDEWKISTEKVKQLLADKREESAGLTGELKGLVGDLQRYQQRRAILENKLKEQRNIFGGRRTALEEQLNACRDHFDEWKGKTTVMNQELHGVEQSIVGLRTRDLLFKRELEQRKEALDTLEEELSEMEEKSASKMARLREALATSKAQHENGVEATLKLNKALKDTKRECIGLTTRAKLFREELEKREKAVAEQEEKVAEAEEEASKVLGKLRSSLSEMEGERDDWTHKATEADRLVLENQEETVGLSTRLDLSMVQLMEHEQAVTTLELKMKGSQRRLPTLKADLDAAKSKRDEWTTRALDIESNLKHRRSEIDGLMQQQKVAHEEVERCRGQASTLRRQLSQKEKHFAGKIAPLRDALEALNEQREEWVEKAKGINKILVTKQEECLPISEKLQSVIDFLTQCSDRMENLESLLQEEAEFMASKVDRVKRHVESQRKEFSEWVDKTKEVQALLRSKEDAAVGLKNRLMAFDGELQTRDGAVAAIEMKIMLCDQSLEAEVSSINSQIEEEHNIRDSIIETTLAKNKEMKKMEDTLSAMEVRRKLFEDEMRLRKETVSILQSKLQEKEEDFNMQMTAMKAELNLKVADRAKWRESSKEMSRLWKETERESVGLGTRLQLFKVEKEKYDSLVADLEKKVNAKASDSVEKITPIRNKLQQEVQERESWGKKTIELKGLLDANRREVVGLSTRSKLFRQELKQKDRSVAKLTAVIKEQEDDFADRIAPLLRELNAQRDGYDAWEKSTQNVKRLLTATKNECASIPTRLDLFRREQKIRDDAVAELEASMSNKDDLVAVQLGFLLNELQLQQKQRGKWKKVTLEMHRLLKETKEQVATLTSKLESNQVAIEKHEETITSYETALRDGRDLANQQLATMKKEVNYQRQTRDNLRKSTEELSRLLEDAKAQCNDLSGKLQSTGAQVQGCTATIEKLETRIVEKKALDASQIESIKEQLMVHLNQRTEWQENTNQLKLKLKEKQRVCAGLRAQMALLKRLQKGDVRSSLSLESEESSSSTSSLPPLTGNGISAHFDRITDITTGASKKKKEATEEEKLTAKMDTLEAELKVQQSEEKKLSDSTKQLERAMGENESKVQALSGQLRSSGYDVDALLKEKENKQSSLNSRLASLTGELLNL